MRLKNVLQDSRGGNVIHSDFCGKFIWGFFQEKSGSDVSPFLGTKLLLISVMRASDSPKLEF